MSTETTTDPITTDNDQAPDEETVDEPTVDVTDEPDNTPDDEPPADEPDAVKAANKQAAGYRRKLRAAEQANEALTARIARYEADEFAELATAAGAASHDDLALVTDLDSFRDDHGALDRERLNAHIAQLKRDRPHWFGQSRRQTPADAGAGRRGRAPGGPGQKKRWGDVIRPR